MAHQREIKELVRKVFVHIILQVKLIQYVFWVTGWYKKVILPPYNTDTKTGTPVADVLWTNHTKGTSLGMEVLHTYANTHSDQCLHHIQYHQAGGQDNEGWSGARWHWRDSLAELYALIRYIYQGLAGSHCHLGWCISNTYLTWVAYGTIVIDRLIILYRWISVFQIGIRDNLQSMIAYHHHGVSTEVSLGKKGPRLQ